MRLRASSSNQQYLSVNDGLQPSASRLRRLVTALIWYAIPVFAVLFAALYVTLAVAWHVNPPMVPVQGQSMKPFLVTGDLVILHGVDPANLKKGDVIAVSVPLADQQKYHIPPEVVHRIISIAHTHQGGYIFQTKGDNNGGPDVFQTPATNVIGLMVGKVTGLGYPILFFRSRQGEIFLGVAALVAIGYFLIGWSQRRQEQDPAIELLEMILVETSELSARIGGRASRQDDETKRQPFRSGDPPPAHTDHEQVDLPVPTGDFHIEEESAVEASFNRFSSVVNANLEMGSRTNQSVQELLEAIREYGEHLRSHTAVVQGMSQASLDLAAVTTQLRESLNGQAKQSQSGQTKPALTTVIVEEEAKATVLPPPCREEEESFELEAGFTVPVLDENLDDGEVEFNSFEAPVEVCPEIPVSRGQDSQLASLVPRCDSRIQLSVELDVTRLLSIADKRDRKAAIQKIDRSTAVLAHIAWAAAASMRLVGIDSYFHSTSSGAAIAAEIERLDPASGVTSHFKLDLLSSASSEEVLENLTRSSASCGCETDPETIESAVMQPRLRVVDLMGTGALMAFPDAQCSQDQVVISVGAIRKVAVTAVSDLGSEGIVPHPVAVVTVSAPGGCTLGAVEHFACSLVRLTD